MFPYLAFYWFSLRFLKSLLHIWNVFANFIMFFFSYYWFYHFQKYHHIRKNQLLLGWRIHNQFSLRFDRIDNDIWCQKERFASHLHGPQKSTTKYVFLDFLENRKKMFSKKWTKKLKNEDFGTLKFSYIILTKWSKISWKSNVPYTYFLAWKTYRIPFRNHKNTKNTTKKMNFWCTPKSIYQRCS